MTIKIVADSRESRSDIIQKLKALPECDVAVQELPVGDYLVRSDIPVERKSATDFVLSIMDRRLFSQVARMRLEFGRSTLIIEGDIYGTRSRISPEALTGAIAYLAFEHCTMIPSKGPSHTAELLVNMARLYQEGGLGYEIPLRGQKPKDLSLQAQFMAEGLPGVGPSTAKRLLLHFGSVEKLVAASVMELRDVHGIGEKTARVIRDVLGAPYA